jgi:uncharacterized UBP type Zn finger protein
MLKTLHRRRGSPHRCHHPTGIRVMAPNSVGCLVCLGRGDDWLDLCLCLSCGWVACSDDSPGHHARDHYEETDHAVAVRLPETRGPRWCYVHRRVV